MDASDRPGQKYFKVPVFLSARKTPRSKNVIAISMPDRDGLDAPAVFKQGGAEGQARF
jgi:hypothetical protein